MTSDSIEKVAVIIHDLWMGWAKEMISKEPNLSPERVTRWQDECFKPYEELSEDMKDLDRHFAQIIIKTLNETA